MSYLKTLLILLLLLVNYAQAKINLIGFFKVGLHSHDLRKGLLGVFERSISII